MTQQADPGNRAAGPVEHGFPHLAMVQASLTALYRRMSSDTVSLFPASVRPEAVEFPADDDLYLGAQRVAKAIVRHYRLPDARIVVSFRDMVHAGSVELAAGPEYFVELHQRFRTDRRDVAAVLSHEVMHVYLHHLGLAFPEVRENEVLTDTAAAYLGAGWLLLDSYREEPGTVGERVTMTATKLGYLTPEEFGYVLAKRAAVFNDDIEPWLTSVQARDAYRAGLARARADLRRPPLLGCGWADRRRYNRDRRAGVAAPAAGYAFDGEGAGPKRVLFPCPTCHQRIRVPLRGKLRARCGLCHTVLECDT